MPMNPLLEYVTNVGNKSFVQQPFTEIDAALFAQLAYLDYDYLIQHNQLQFSDLQSDAALKGATNCTWSIELHQQILKVMRTKIRYRSVSWQTWSDFTDAKTEEQFSAITFHLQQDDYCISYRGTNDTLAGWKEDANLFCMPTIPGQQRALKYATQQVQTHPGNYFMTGHSKGGNLAIFSFVNLARALQNKIAHVFNFDGPGNSLIDPQLQNRVTKIVPETSFIGTLMENQAILQVVKSQAHLFWQHDVLTWQTTDLKFQRSTRLNWLSRRIRKITTRWLTNTPEAVKTEFFNCIYRLLQANDAKTLTEIKRSLPRALPSYFIALRRVDPKTRRQVWLGIHELLSAIVLSFVINDKPAVRSRISKQII
ncbi:hypothetical protein FC83_GL001179 [Agrilactobacillus composti DSM 18527 = JCM 14202]|uniref:DUF2974 domain-containing protein n=2 Tax=Agrilactobacillus TaxID=2767875 RepID=A0A0R1XZ97_9LACO|nr:hypothetical protein FC83_GL001179 [Agrilactobacillus composti DSM 18527 = JCM 14202]